MSGRLFVDLLIDRFKSAGIPALKGARLTSYRSKGDQTELADLINTHAQAWHSFEYKSDGDLQKLAQDIAEQVCTKFGLSSDAALVDPLTDVTLRLISNEPGFFPFSLAIKISTLSPLQISEISHDLNHRIRFITDETTQDAAINTLFHLLAGVLENMPSALAAIQNTALPTLTTDLVSLVDQPYDFMTSVIAHFISSDDVQENGLYAPLCRQLYRNVLEASGVVVDPDQPLLSYDLDKPTLPINCTKEAARVVAQSFFANTPILDLMIAPAQFALPEEARFEHCHVFGGIGHGKTQCLQYLLHEDLIQAVHDERRSIVVIDSQGSLIRNISACALFNPEQEFSLSDRFVLIDPTDIERPPALNLFNPGLERMEGYTPRQREVAFNSLVDIYGRFFGALLGAELTARQGAVFRYLARLMLTIEGATIHTLIALMDDVRPFAGNIAKLDPTARRFFEKEFMRKGFNATRQQIKDRLYAILSIPTFDRLFSAPKSKINFFDALNNGKIILINTARGLLKKEGSAIFGRFMLALIEHAITERDNIPEDKRNPVFLYMDEAHEYFDDTVETLIIEARKFKCGLTLAHQDLAQLSSKLRAIFLGNTTIKIAGGVSHSDARALASDMRTTPDFLLARKKFEREGFSEFALSVRNVTPQALKVTIPFGFLEGQPKLEPHQLATLLEINRQKVGYDPRTEASPEPTPPPEVNEPQEESAAAEPSEPTSDRPTAPQSDHGAVQRDLAEVAWSRGFGVEIEHTLPNGKRVDLALFGHGSRIAIEISVTNRKDYELSNIEKALEAGFNHIWMVADDPKHRETIASHVRQSLSHDQLSRVTFGTMGDALAWLKRFQVPEGEPATVAGYDVRTEIVPLSSLSDHHHRIEQLRHLLNA